MPFYVVYNDGDEVAKVYDKLEDAMTHVQAQHLEAAVRALEGIKDIKVADYKVAKKRPIPYEWRHGNLLLVKCLLDFAKGAVMVLRDGQPARFAENRHLGIYLVMKDELAGCAEWKAKASMWLGLAADAVPTDPLTYLVERRGLALHWIEERMRNQIHDFKIVELQ